MLAGEGLQASSKGARVRFSGGKRTVIDGPFTETKELIAGFWLWQVKSLDEAIEWLKRAPFDEDRGRDSPGVRSGGFRRGVHARAARAGGPDARASPEWRKRRADVGDRVVEREPQPEHKEVIMQVQPYLSFEGRAEEAIEFYKKRPRRQGDDADAIQRKPRQAAARHDAARLGAEGHAFARMTIGDSVVMATDGYCTGKPKFEGISLSLTAKDDAEAKRLFDNLADGGEVTMPLDKTFFASSFGMVKDRFGVSWMVIAAPISP